MKKKYKILFVEDCSADAELIMHSLLNANLEFSGQLADTSEQFRSALTGFCPDVIICDQALPQFDSFSAMKILKDIGKNIPFILVTGSLSDQEALEYLCWGAYDYILKFNLARLPFAVKNALKEHELATEKETAELEHLQLKKRHQINIERNKDITDSISYAKEIQNALLPAQGYIHKYFPESFLINMPKHIVSGDFYWFSEYEGKYIVAVGDCTGHGVPAALISMMGYNKLDHIVNVSGITEPGTVLSMLNTAIKESFRKRDNGFVIRDGMDIALCVIDPRNNRLEFAGANRPLYYFSNGELGIIKGDKKCIGGIWDSEHSTYTRHTLPLDTLNTVYLFTDGILDQFGGEAEKRFLSIRLKKLLYSLQTVTMETQKEVLTTTLNAWKGDQEQTDDICMLGIRL